MRVEKECEYKRSASKVTVSKQGDRVEKECE